MERFRGTHEAKMRRLEGSRQKEWRPRLLQLSRLGSRARKGGLVQLTGWLGDAGQGAHHLPYFRREKRSYCLYKPHSGSWLSFCMDAGIADAIAHFHAPVASWGDGTNPSPWTEENLE